MGCFFKKFSEKLLLFLFFQNILLLKFQFRIFRFKHTEYLPANMTFGMIAFAGHWMLLGILQKDFYIVVCLFFVYRVNIG